MKRSAFFTSSDPLDGIPFKKTNVLIRAIRHESPREVRCLLKKHCDPNAPVGDNYVYPLTAACYVRNKRNRLNIIQVLLRHGADPSLPDAHGRNSVMHACALSLRDEVELLVKDCDFELNAVDSGGDTALHWCAKAGDPDTLSVLLREMQRYRLDINIHNNIDLTPLSLALMHRHHLCAKILHEAGGFPKLTWAQLGSLSSEADPATDKRRPSTVSFSNSQRQTILPRARPATLSLKKTPTSLSLGDGRSRACSLTGKENTTGDSRARPKTCPHIKRSKSFQGSTTTAHKTTAHKVCVLTPKHAGDDSSRSRESFEPQNQQSTGIGSHVLTKRHSSAPIRLSTSIDCINALLGSAMYSKTTSPAFCHPSRQLVKMDSQWLATINAYKLQKTGSYEELLCFQKVQSHVSFKSVARQIMSSASSSSCPSSASSGSRYTLARMKRAATSPRFRLGLGNNSEDTSEA